MKITINESQANQLIANLVIKENMMQINRIKLVKDFLDKNFQRADISRIGNDGYAEDYPIVMYIDSYKQPIKKMTDEELLDMLLDKFQHLMPNQEENKEFLIKVIKAWYYKDKKLDLGLL